MAIAVLAAPEKVVFVRTAFNTECQFNTHTTLCAKVFCSFFFSLLQLRAPSSPTELKETHISLRLGVQSTSFVMSCLLTSARSGSALCLYSQQFTWAAQLTGSNYHWSTFCPFAAAALFSALCFTQVQHQHHQQCLSSCVYSCFCLWESELCCQESKPIGTGA